MAGLEKFVSGWSNIENYKFAFAIADLTSAGFSWTYFADFDLSSAVTTPQGDLLGDPPGTQLLVATVKTLTGAGIPGTPVSAHYVNGFSASVPFSFTVPEGLGANKCFFSMETPDGAENVDTISRGAPIRSGIISFYGALQKPEPFTNSFWGTPDPGL